MLKNLPAEADGRTAETGDETQSLLDAAETEKRVQTLMSPEVLNAVAIPFLRAAAAIQPIFGDEWNNGVAAALATVDPTKFSADQKMEIVKMFSEGKALAYVAADLAERTGDLAFFFPYLVKILIDPKVSAQSRAETCKVVCTFMEEAPAESPVFTQENILLLLDVLVSNEPYINMNDIAGALCEFLEKSSNEALKAAAKEKLSALAPQVDQAVDACRIEKFFASRLKNVLYRKVV